MDGKNGLILWVLGGTGILLMYSAYKNKSPKDTLAQVLGTASKPVAPVANGSSGFEAGQFPSASVRGDNFYTDQNGAIVGVVPAPYRGTFIPPTGGVVTNA